MTMSRSLLLIAAAGFALCIGFFAFAFLIAGDQVFHINRPLEAVKPLVDLATRKQWSWNGGDTLSVDGPVVVHYQHDGPQGITVTGPAELLEHVQVGGGQIGADLPRHHARGERLDAVVGGVPIRRFRIAGDQDLQLGHIDQDNLDIRISGKGSVSGEGKVNQLDLVVAGKGDVNLGGLSVQDAKVMILGNTDATLSPHHSLVLTIAGHGVVHLLTHPESIQKTILGSGRIIEVGASETASESTSQSGSQSGFVLQDGGPGRSFAVGGSGNQQLGHFESGAVKLVMTGSGSTEADGQVDKLVLAVSGSGKARLGRLMARQATVTIAGSGSAEIAPQDEAHITILGSGNVYLLSRPRSIEQNIMGSGRIIERY
jgi:hypothetical protein